VLVTSAAEEWVAEGLHRPRQGESLSGFVARAAAQEDLPNVHELTSMAGIVWSQRPEPSRGDCDLEPLARFLRLAPSELSDRSYPRDPHRLGRRLYFGASVDRRHLVHGERRFSPATLREEATHLATWQLRPFPFCERSGELLVSHCSDAQCGTRQGWYHAAGIALCDVCGEPLQRAGAGRVPEQNLGDLRSALGIVHPDPERRRASFAVLPPALREADPGDALDLLVAVAGVHSPAIRCRADTRIIRRGADPLAVCAAMAEAWRIAIRWPQGFEDLAAHRIATRAGRFGDGNGGATMHFLDLPSNPAAPAPLSALVSDLRRSLGQAGQRGIGSNPASSLPHLTATGLVRMRREGALATVFALVDGEPQPLLVRSEVQALSAALKRSVPNGTAASRLGVTEDGVRQLVAADLLATVRASAMRREREQKIDIASVEELTGRFESSAASLGEGWLLLTAVLRMIGGREKPWAPIVQVLLAGTVRFALGAGARPLLGRVSVEPQAVTSLIGLETPELGSARGPDRVTRTDALVLLNLHQRHAASVLARWPEGPGRVVPVEELLELARDRISLGEVAARMDVHAVEVKRMMWRLGIESDGPLASRQEVERAMLCRWADPLMPPSQLRRCRSSPVPPR
jgi:hypothetical protein